MSINGKGSLLSEYVFASKFARNLSSEKLESWDDSVDRLHNCHKKHISDWCFNVRQAADTLDGSSMTRLADDKLKHDCINVMLHNAIEAIRRKEILPSMRSLQTAGPGLLKNHCSMYNCTASYVDRPRFFEEAFFWLLSGSGVGFSVQKQHIAKMPLLASKSDTKAIAEVYRAEDSILGWAKCVGQLMDAFFYNPQNPDRYGQFFFEVDYSDISPVGSPLSSGIGCCPGPEPLKQAINKSRAILLKIVGQGRRRINPIEAYDIMMHLADAVASGGIRRSATICIFSSGDEEMLKAKTGDWYVRNPQRARSNNSILLNRNTATYKELASSLAYAREFGEPGVIWADDLDSLFNPCVEANLYSYDEQGRSGWQGCNLCEINGAMYEWTNGDYRENCDRFFSACESAALIGTLQASYTKFPYIGEVTEQIFRRENLLGVSITGIAKNWGKWPSEVLQHGASIIKKTNETVSCLLGINPSSRTTCIKPSGTTSCILDSSSGIHPYHAQKYIRRVSASYAEQSLADFRNTNPGSVLKQSESSYIINFNMEAPKGAITRDQVSAIRFLDEVKFFQENWVTPGRNLKHAVKPFLNHSVSNTCTVKDGEWEDLFSYIYRNRQFFSGISLMPSSPDNAYPNPPFSEVLDEPVTDIDLENATQWEKNLSAQPPNYSPRTFGNWGITDSLACSSGQCDVL